MVHAMKPYVICHMCTTIDARIIVDRWPRLPAGKDGASLFESTADSFGIGAWMVGNTTMREFAGRNVRLKAARRRVERTDHVADPRAGRFAIGADAKGELRFQKPDVDGDHVVLLVTDRVSNDYLAHLQEAGVSYLFCGKDHVDLKVALDQISQVVVPVADGGRGIQTIFDIPGDPPRKAAAALRLRSYRRLPGGVSWLRYRVVRRSRR
jgi:riboflavin biosynthesis pyrimidine reductase